MILVVIPTYNEIENIEDLVNYILHIKKYFINVLIVDDGSPDGTGKKADELTKKYPNRVHVLHRKEKNGLGPAYIAGFKLALSKNAEYIIQMDADFSHDPKYLINLIDAIKTSDLVIGSRYIKGGSVAKSWSAYRKLLSWFANSLYCRIILNMGVKDATAGYRAWKASTLKQLNLSKIKSNGYAFQIEMAYTTFKKNLKIKEIPIYFPDRARGDSKMGLKIVLEAVLRVWEIKRRYS